MAKDSISPTRPASPPPVAANGKPAPQPEASAKVKDKDKKPAEPRDVFREIAETIVFVVVLVLMLKTFVAEAFVIPTGSMAETLYGYHKMVTCDKCGFVFPVNCSSEVDPQGGVPVPVLGCRCPNCLHEMSWPTREEGPGWSSGDRVLVAKFLYDNNHLWQPKRHEVFVFKYPGHQEFGHIEGGPQKADTAMNYIKRCEGLPTETIAIFGGNLYVTRSLKYPAPSGDPLNFWMDPNMNVNDADAIEFFQQSLKRRMAGQGTAEDFEIIRKPLDTMLDVRRIVYDNDFQPSDLAGKLQRWQIPDNSSWAGNDPKMPKVFTHAGGAAEEWLEYKHLLREKARYATINNPDKFEDDPRRLITNNMGYNSGQGERNTDGRDWVGDLMLDCHVKVTDPQGELVLELARGIDRFQARFRSGQRRLQPGAADRQNRGAAGQESAESKVHKTQGERRLSCPLRELRRALDRLGGSPTPIRRRGDLSPRGRAWPGRRQRFAAGTHRRHQGRRRNIAPAIVARRLLHDYQSQGARRRPARRGANDVRAAGALPGPGRQ